MIAVNQYSLPALSSFAVFQVVGSQARILYSNAEGRVAIALAFNKAVADGRLKVRLYSIATITKSRMYDDVI